jgi:hypothetical protein
MGATAILTQAHQQFDLIDREADFSRYKVLVLADGHRMNAALRDKVAGYVASGGGLLLSHESGLDAEGKSFAVPGVGVDYEGPWKHEAQYLEVLEGAREGIPEMVHELYENGSAVKAQAGTTVLARIWGGYFDRDYRHFQVAQTPFVSATDYAGATQRGRVVYLAPPLFRMYARQGYAVYRQLAVNGLRRLLPAPLIRADLPSAAQATMTEQPGRRIVHLLCYIPERRTPDLDIVEDVIPLANVSVAARLPARPKTVYLAPQRQELAFEYRDQYAYVRVPSVAGHQMVVFEA